MAPLQKLPEERLLFRRQFILGPRHVEALPSWNRCQVRNSLRLTVHPDLPVTRATEGAKSVTLLGYALDATDPRATDDDIARELLRRLCASGRPEGLVCATADLGGRWVLIADDGNEAVIFHDAMGLREVFFTDRSLRSETWCASQPNLLAEALGLSRDPQAEADFIQSNVYREWSEYRWPADACAYREVRHLLPNHLLDLRTGACRRYWPDRPIPQRSVEDAAEEVSSLLTNLIRGAARRFPLALATTAGWDTRLILAASKPVAGEVYYYTLFRPEATSDITTSPRLVARLGFAHHMVKFPDRMDPEFERIYKRNVTEAHEYWGRMAQGLYESYPSGRVSMTGNAAEIARARIRIEVGEPLTARRLARLMCTALRFQDRLEANSFVVAAWDRWLSGIGDLKGVHPLDVFYWEQFAGNFAAMGESEWDIVQEEFTPYDCRRLLTAMLSVDEVHRQRDRPKLYVEMIRRLWPEVLCEPVNQPYEGRWTPVLRALRSVRVNRLVPPEARRRVRRVLGIG
jgi:hypothetical protein